MSSEGNVSSMISPMGNADESYVRKLMEKVMANKSENWVD
jgi:hypothetical protein